jgi:hypothetical protein
LLTWGEGGRHLGQHPDVQFDAIVRNVLEPCLVRLTVVSDTQGAAPPPCYQSAACGQHATLILSAPLPASLLRAPAPRVMSAFTRIDQAGGLLPPYPFATLLAGRIIDSFVGLPRVKLYGTRKQTQPKDQVEWPGWIFHPNKDSPSEDFQFKQFPEGTDLATLVEVANCYPTVVGFNINGTFKKLIEAESKWVSLGSKATQGLYVRHPSRSPVDLKVAFAEFPKDSGSHVTDNCVKDDNTSYCTNGKHTCANIVLAARDDQAFSPTSIVIRQPVNGFTAPVKWGMVFVFDDKELWRQTSSFDKFTFADYEKYMSSKMVTELVPTDPVGFFDFTQPNARPFG